jgi:SAM-dependent methyltransferase
LAWLRDRRQFNSRQQLPRTCPICDYHGPFLSVGSPPRRNARCPSCDSRERHRLAYLLYREIGLFEDKSLRILHFAPEKFMARLMRQHAGYVTADAKMSDVERPRADMQALADKAESFDVVIAHHVLEHVASDFKALEEVYRVLKPGGRAILSVPINWSRAETFETDAFRTVSEKTAAFGAADHVRYYGRDFPGRIAQCGFAVHEYRADPELEVALSLGRDEAIHIATKRRQGVKASGSHLSSGRLLDATDAAGRA